MTGTEVEPSKTGTPRTSPELSDLPVETDNITSAVVVGPPPRPLKPWAGLQGIWALPFRSLHGQGGQEGWTPMIHSQQERARTGRLFYITGGDIQADAHGSPLIQSEMIKSA